MRNTSLIIEINSLPKAIREEVADFVAFLKKKTKTKSKLKSREFGFAKGKIKLSADFDVSEWHEKIVRERVKKTKKSSYLKWGDVRKKLDKKNGLAK